HRNDTHPALTVAELMRTFLDEQSLPWEQAWAITLQTCAFTNHTLLPEALERWPVEMLERMLPRHVQIIQEINRRVVAEVERRFPAEPAMAPRVSIVDGAEVRLANLGRDGGHAGNGVPGVE